MLTLSIKKKWFDLILSGEKKEEYREIKPYWDTRFETWLGIPKGEMDFFFREVLKDDKIPMPVLPILFRNGYSKESPSFIAKCMLSIGTGKEEWEAEKDKQYFVLKVHEILERKEKDVCSE